MSNAPMNDRSPIDYGAEWLETDGMGGFASGTVGAGRARRYHGILAAALTPPTGRHLLVAGFDAWLERPGADGAPETRFLTRQRYAPDVATAAAEIVRFRRDPWPTWTYRLEDGTEILHELLVPQGHAAVVLRWRLVRPANGVRLLVRPFLAGRDIHALHHENPSFRFEATAVDGHARWAPYPGLPAIRSGHDGSYRHEPVWYRRFELDTERARGFDFLEDLGSPGILTWDLSAGSAAWLLGAEGLPGAEVADGDPRATADRLARRERLRRSRFGSPLRRAADQYLVARGAGRTVIAGYPWFTDWGRDTFIALRGLCFSTGRLADATSILIQWSNGVSEGMLPNRFVDQGGQPEFNSVDASLWYVVAVAELLGRLGAAGKRLGIRDRKALNDAVEAILDGYARGTRYGIHADADGLLAAGEAGVQLTWMDARVGSREVTPRIGKPVEVQALWINALATRSDDPRWRALAEAARSSFERRFWNESVGGLYDVVDVDGVAGRVDPTVRPNQIFAVGGLPEPVLAGSRARRVVELVERSLLTPLGLRSLAPWEPGYCPRYEGGPEERDGAYHQGTVWPWLLGPFVEAWLRVGGATSERKGEARRRFFAPLLEHLDRAGLGHVSEVADGDPPHRPGGCPFQAWSVGEALRIEEMIGAGGESRSGKRPGRTR